MLFTAAHGLWKNGVGKFSPLFMQPETEVPLFRDSRPASGFTLIELLVVIAIIANSELLHRFTRTRTTTSCRSRTALTSGRGSGACQSRWRMGWWLREPNLQYFIAR